MHFPRRAFAEDGFKTSSAVDSQPMRIVLISEIFCDGMGYLENVLPKYLAQQGAQVEVVASSLPPEHRHAASESAYQRFVERRPPGTYQAPGGFRVHILPATRAAGHFRLVGLGRKLASLQPDIVQTMTPIGWIAVDAAWYRLALGYRLFSGCHYHASVFPLAQRRTSILSPARMKCFLQRTVHGRIASMVTERCYAVSADCAEIAKRFFGVPEDKVVVSPLGVDTDVFHPASTFGEESARPRLRARLGFSARDVVGIYTGRFSEDKNPLLLAQAIARLANKGRAFKGVFVGNGPQSAAIAECAACVTHPFVSLDELADLYRSADIGVWPAQESMSMLDAAACGLPMIANDKMRAMERIEGNGVAYRLHDLDDLERALLALEDSDVRRRLGSVGAQKMAGAYSWRSIAIRRLQDYEAALRRKDVPVEANAVRTP
jgi:glycosyltransferase involved in cell wall biosynthesis